MKRILLIATLLLLSTTATADRVKVRLFSNSRIEALNVSFDLGEYHLFAADSLLEANLGEGLSVILQATANGVHVAVNDYEYGTFKQISLRATDTACILCLNPRNVKQRTYEGDLIISCINSTALKIINEVDFETYLAGVVQSEIYGIHSDIFRIQAIISRTWALRNMNKHKSEGYNFCDHVHCQAYQNRCIRPDIMLGTIQSSGETIVDSTGALIETPFHSNSGGETCNSEDVWRAALPYLRSVPDTFSYRMKQSNWTKVINKDKWLNYFKKTHHLNIDDPAVRDTLLNFTQEQRRAEILGVRLTRVRSDFQLKSTFFSVSVDPNTGNVVLNGHGYGHGVGLSQEGTIRMVSLGYAYDDIIRHYYTGSSIHYNPATSKTYVSNYVKEIEQIIAEDKANPGRVKSKKDDWLGQLFRLHDRQIREEVFDPNKTELESDWQYSW
ncbi:MAG: SpoIID/LytB domain-containing protein [Bacteroidales bacterium]|nr:SpoIID/LytB domain-containing protein [Bacteroidales bacterium]